MDSAKQQTATELKQLCRAWDNSIANNEVSDIGRFMASDWVIIGTEGGITPKQNFLKFIESGDLVHKAMDFNDIRIEVYGDTGVVTSKGTSSGTYKDVPFSYYEWSTNVFIKSEDRWLCVLTMLTPAVR
jgi:ketosteroid isomerase-like protein